MTDLRVGYIKSSWNNPHKLISWFLFMNYVLGIFFIKNFSFHLIDIDILIRPEFPRDQMFIA